MGLPRWLQTVIQVAPIALAFTPAAPLAPFITAAVHSAEQIPGAKGPQKLAAAVAIAQAGISAAQAAGVKIDADTTNTDIVAAVNAVVKATNDFHAATVATATVATEKP